MCSGKASNAVTVCDCENEAEAEFQLRLEQWLQANASSNTNATCAQMHDKSWNVLEFATVTLVMMLIMYITLRIGENE